MGIIVIVAYKPKPGKQAALEVALKKHVQLLRQENLVTDRAPVLMTSTDGTILEVFEWMSKASIEAAHSNPVVLKMWETCAEVCDYVPLSSVNEAGDVFAEFTAIDC